MAEFLFGQEGPLRTLFDALPAMMFVFDEDLRVLDANRAARASCTETSELLFKAFCGNILQCVNARDSGEGCGKTEFCGDCVIRKSTEVASTGRTVVRDTHRMRLHRNGKDIDVVFLVTATPLEFEDQNLVAVTLEDISELMELRQIVSICSNCKKVRTPDDLWQHVEAYMNKYIHVQFSHGICPVCEEKLYADI